eukprot:scaffold1.g5261.t1
MALLMALSSKPCATAGHTTLRLVKREQFDSFAASSRKFRAAASFARSSSWTMPASYHAAAPEPFTDVAAWPALPSRACQGAMLASALTYMAWLKPTSPAPASLVEDAADVAPLLTIAAAAEEDTAALAACTAAAIFASVERRWAAHELTAAIFAGVEARQVAAAVTAAAFRPILEAEAAAAAATAAPCSSGVTAATATSASTAATAAPRKPCCSAKHATRCVKASRAAAAPRLPKPAHTRAAWAAAHRRCPPPCAAACVRRQQRVQLQQPRGRAVQRLH